MPHLAAESDKEAPCYVWLLWLCVYNRAVHLHHHPAIGACTLCYHVLTTELQSRNAREGSLCVETRSASGVVETPMPLSNVSVVVAIGGTAAWSAHQMSCCARLGGTAGGDCGCRCRLLACPEHHRHQPCVCFRRGFAVVCAFFVYVCLLAVSFVRWHFRPATVRVMGLCGGGVVCVCACGVVARTPLWLWWLWHFMSTG